MPLSSSKDSEDAKMLVCQIDLTFITGEHIYQIVSQGIIRQVSPQKGKMKF